MNKKRGVYNILTGIIGQALIIALGVVIPRLFLTSFGSEYNGLLNSVGQAFSYLALLEAGVGGASLQALYGPLVNGDKREASAILNATGHYYRKTGYYYAASVVGLSVLFPFIVTSSISALTTILIILLAGIPGVISYIFQGKYNILLLAEGKNYVLTLLSTSTTVLVSCSKIMMLLAGCNIVFFQACCMCISLLQVAFIYFYIRRYYGWIDFSIAPNFEAISQKSAVLVSQICDLVFRNTSVLILAVFCDLKVVSVYALFNMLFSMVRTAMDHVGKGLAYLMGQTYNKDRALFIRYHDTYETYRMSMIYSLYVTALLFIIPFMRLYTEGITDADYLNFDVALLFTIIFLLSGARACESDLIGYAQHFRKTQSRCIAEAAINLIVALSLVGTYGIYGVLWGTIAALFYRTNDMILYANKRILSRSPWITYKRFIVNSILFVLLYYLFNLIPWPIASYMEIIMSAGLVCVASTLVFWLVASLADWECCRYVVRGLLRR